MVVRFFWSVQSFYTLPIKPGESLLSPTFYAESSKAAEFCLKFKGMGFPSSFGYHVANLSLCRCDKNGPESVQVEYTISLQGEKNPTVYRRRFSKPPQNALYQSYEIDGMPLTTGNIIKDEVMAVCVIRSYADERHECSAVSEKDDFDDLSGSFTEMFKESLFSDAVIRIQDQEFEVHKAIFDVRCPGLLKECQVKNPRKPYSQNGDSNIQTLLYYIYNGKCKSDDVPDDLYYLLNKCNDSIFKHLFTSFPILMRTHTSFEVNEVRISWKIENFLKSSFNEKYCLAITEGHPSTWFRIAFFTFQGGSEQLNFMMRKMCKKSAAFVRCKIKLDRTLIFEGGHLVVDEGPWVVQLDHTLNTILKKQKGGIANFSIEIEVTDGKPIHAVNKVHSTFTLASTQNITEKLYELGRDMGRLYENPMHSDVTVQIKDKRIPAHKAILSARSPVFHEMLEQNKSRKKKAEIVINDLDENVALYMLYYIYSAQVVDLNVDLAYEMYNAAALYKISQLKKKCSTFLKNSIYATNVGEILLFADTQNDHELKSCVHSLIKRDPNRMLENKESMGIMRSYHYLHLEVLKEIYKHISKNVN